MKLPAAPLPAWATAVLVLWVAQLAFLGYHFADLTWENYWWCRSLYRPGLRAFSAAMGGVLPGHYFAWYSRTGAVTGFLVSSLLYAVLAVAAVTALLRVAPVGGARRR